MLSVWTNARPYTLWMLDLHQRLPDGPTPHIGTVFGHIGLEGAEELAQAMHFDEPAIVLQRLASGRHCYLARSGGRIVTYGWVTFDEEWIGELGLNFRLKAGEAYIWDCATLPAYRGLRLYPALLAHMLRELQTQGRQRVWICADSANLASQRGMYLAGFQPIADLFLPYDPSPQSPWIRVRPGISEQLMKEVRQAISLVVWRRECPVILSCRGLR